MPAHLQQLIYTLIAMKMMCQQTAEHICIPFHKRKCRCQRKNNKQHTATHQHVHIAMAHTLKQISTPLQFSFNDALICQRKQYNVEYVSRVEMTMHVTAAMTEPNRMAPPFRPSCTVTTWHNIIMQQ